MRRHYGRTLVRLAAALSRGEVREQVEVLGREVIL
jgi:hypothetical protein